MDRDDSTQDDLLDSSVFTILQEEEQAPRLRIHHLMLWALCSAVYLTMSHSYLTSSELPEEYRTVQQITGLLHGIISGAAMTGCILLAYDGLLYDRPLIRQPGHWFLLVMAALSLLWIPYWILLLMGHESFEIGEWMQGVQCLFLCFPLACYIAAAWRSTEPRWTVFFVANLAETLVKLAAHFVWMTGAFGFEVYRWVGAAYWLSDVVMLFWTLVVLILDKRSGIRRDWLHWLGMGTLAAGQCSSLVWQIAMRFS